MDRRTYIFSDASFDPKSKMGVCANLVVTEEVTASNDRSWIAGPMQLDIFTQINCTKLEVESVIKILEMICNNVLPKNCHIFTDCRTVVDLPARRDGLEQKNYISKGSGKLLKNAEVYKKFFWLYDQAHPTISWIKGHKAKNERSEFDEYFAKVDLAARKLLRSLLP